MSTAMARSNTGAKIILLTAIAGALYGASMVVSNLAPAWESWSNHRARIAADQIRIEGIRKDGYDLYFANVCGDYFNAGFIDKHWNLRNLAWCADYEDRMPDRK